MINLLINISLKEHFFNQPEAGFTVSLLLPIFIYGDMNMIVFIFININIIQSPPQSFLLVLSFLWNFLIVFILTTHFSLFFLEEWFITFCGKIRHFCLKTEESIWTSHLSCLQTVFSITFKWCPHLLTVFLYRETCRNETNAWKRKSCF